MMTRDVFSEHKQDYTIKRKTSVLDKYNNESFTYTTGGTINCMFTPVSDEASIQEYGEHISEYLQAAVYDETEIDEHDRIEIEEQEYEFVSIKKFPSYRLVQVRRLL